MEILPQTRKEEKGVLIPLKVKMTLFLTAYSYFNRSLSITDPDPMIAKWGEMGDVKYSTICWALWELGIYEDFCQTTEKDVREWFTRYGATEE